MMISNTIFYKGLKLLTLIVTVAFSCSYGYGQCLEKDLVAVELSNNELKIDLSNFSGDLTAYKFRLYNYETTNDYISINLLSANQANLEFNKNEKQVIVKNIPDGEYLVIFENAACENVYVGEGFSGFPYSGIRIE